MCVCARACVCVRVCVCVWLALSRVHDKVIDAARSLMRRVLGEPKSANAPHASVCAVSSNTKCEDRYKFSKILNSNLM